jgi:hypothetical protein
MTYEKIKAVLKNFSIVDSSIRSKDFIYLLATHIYELDDDNDDPSDKKSNVLDTEQLPNEAIRIIAHYPNKPKDKQWGFQTLKNIEFMKCASSSIPSSQLVAVSISGSVFSFGGGKVASFEQAIPEHKNGPLRGSVRQLLTINGTIYAIQGNRGICKRIGENNWHSLCANLPISKSNLVRDEKGFNCAAGLSENNLYAGGGNGDLWHYDGTNWKELSFPSNEIIEVMCVDPMGKVYIGCKYGQVYSGNHDTWEKIETKMSITSLQSMVWYQEKVWCSSDYGIWTINNGQIEKANIPENCSAKAGYLSVGDGLLLIAGDTGAAYFDGLKWNNFLKKQKR